MTPKQADQLIAKSRRVTVHSKEYNETFEALFVRRDRFSIYSEAGGAFDRKDLEIVRMNGE